MSKYDDWIKQNVKSYEDAYGECKSVTKMMVKEFPELKRVRGYYFCLCWGQRMHWWCVETDGNIIDPTKEQFPTKGTCRYEPLKEGDPISIGKCVNCGEYCYKNRYFCSDKCRKRGF